MARHDIAAVVWAPHEARTEAFARSLGASLHNIHVLKERRPLLAPIKYPIQWWLTWRVLFRDRPEHVFVTNSPPIAGLCVMLYCRLAGANFVMDVHPPSLFDRKWAWARPLQRFTSRFAMAVVTDQERFAALFRGWGATTIVLRNPPRTVDASRFPKSTEQDARTFVYVGTFAADEPVDALIEAARRLPDVQFVLLGNRELAPRSWTEGAPRNVSFAGYLKGEAYWERLHRSAGVVVLTKHPHSLLGGAQDGMRVGRPLVLSDQPVLREHFTAGTVFADNSADGLVAALRETLDRSEELAADVVTLRDEMDASWRRGFARLAGLMGADGYDDSHQEESRNS